jgi:hypothetical protein
MRHQDELLNERLSGVLDRLQAGLAARPSSSPLRGRPVHHEWVDRDHLLIHLDDVPAVNEMELLAIQAVLAVPSHWAVTAQHSNRLRVTLHCRLDARPDPV